MVETSVFVVCDRGRLAEIAHAASGVRRAVAASDFEAIDVVDFLEFEIQKNLKNFRLIIEGDELFSGDVLAAARLDPVEIVVRESVYVDALGGHGGARFILAHEMGHIFLCHDRTKSHDISSHSFSMRLPHKSEARHFEWEANEFACELLMPSKSTEECTLSEAPEVAKRYGVSISFVTKRLQSLHLRRARWEEQDALQRRKESRQSMRIGGPLCLSEIDEAKECLYERYEPFRYSDLGALTYYALKKRDSKV